jgi:hypothetical protein
MPKKPKKPANQLTTEEAIQQLFPKKIITEIKRELDSTDDHDGGGESTSLKHRKS